MGKNDVNMSLSTNTKLQQEKKEINPPLAMKTTQLTIHCPSRSQAIVDTSLISLG